MVLRVAQGRRFAVLLLVLAAGMSATVSHGSVQAGFHPFALLASLLPLQLAALLWCLASTGASPRLAAMRPPASD